ncbi:MAG: preprotein translocase subunit SecA [Peptostreptococcaceae bacterium]|nr:preprotein translocase subunit SecA [Peptostreptococcaceae bacterium]
MGLLGLMNMILGSMNDKEVKKVMKIVEKVEAFEPQIKSLDDESLKEKTNEFRNRIEKGETLDDLLPEAFAVVREAAVRTVGMRHFPVQILGGIVLHQGRIAEMKTGEGKTLAATLAAYLNAIEGKGVHVVTVNDYLASRDKEWMGRIYEFLGLTVGCLVHGLDDKEKNEAYLCDIVYGTNNEFGFDYLRDNMVIYKEGMVQKQLNFAIVDEVDSILVDEARTPLIISGAGNKTTELYMIADKFVTSLKNELDYIFDEKERNVILTDDEGIPKAEKFFKIENLADPENMEISHRINQALRAYTLMKKDKDYVIKDGEILIVDEFTGRLMLGRRYSNGLHQAIEAKEGLKVRKESQTLATITLQNYFRMYSKLSGMTGTAKTEEDEFKQIYNMDVVVVPTNMPILRDDMPDAVYKSIAGKFRNAVEEITLRHETGQPVLVGTIAIETSEFISSMLKKRGIKHEVLNAKQHERESEIVAQAGRYGAVTIATNMAGRGTDIVLGGNAEFMAKKEMRKLGYDEEIINRVTGVIEFSDDEFVEAKKIYDKIFLKYKSEADVEGDKVKAAGGLHILGTERHESRRIDNQLRGRSGRQGDAGSSQFFISLEDDLMRLFGSDRIQGVVDKLGMSDDDAIEASILSKSIEGAQKKVEGRNFSIRKHVLQYDDVMNRQREIIYSERRKVLQGEDLKEYIFSMIEKLIDDVIEVIAMGSEYPEEWDMAGLSEKLKAIFMPVEALEYKDIESLDKETLRGDILRMATEMYDKKEEEIGKEKMRDLERVILLRVVDSKWIDHIDAMDQLKQGIGLRAIGNEDPVRAYQMEGFDMFDEMIKNIQEDMVKYMYHVTIETKTQRKQLTTIEDEKGSDLDYRQGMRVGTPANAPSDEKAKPFVSGKKVGRNDPCPCGSGKKYKKCCGKDK